jgi:hypothetical protein
MSARSRAATNLAWHLTDKTGIAVRVGWDNPSGRPGDGVWRAEWVDGPTITTMQALAAEHVRWLAPLDLTALRYSRRFTPTAWAAALIAMAERGELPDNASETVALVEYELHNTDATAWAPLWPTAIELAQRCNERPTQMAEALLTAAVTKPRHETRPSHCDHCGASLSTPARTGRPRRWCTAACRTRGWRTRSGTH